MPYELVQSSCVFPKGVAYLVCLARVFMRKLFSPQGGLNDQARQTCKNLEYAIAIATRPGAIEYYRPPEEAKRIVENGDLAVLTRKIGHLQRDIDQVLYRM